MEGPGAKIISAKGTGKTVDGGFTGGGEWGQCRRAWSSFPTILLER